MTFEDQCAEEVVIQKELKKGRGQHANMDSAQVKTKRAPIAAECPCCGYWFNVDDRGIKVHLLRRKLVHLDRAGWRHCRDWLVQTWGMQILPPTSRDAAMISPSLGRIFQGGDSRSLSFIAKICEDAEIDPFFAIAWRASGKTFGDNWFCCPIGEFFEVVRRIAKDAPEFKRRLLQSLSPEGEKDDLAVEQESFGAVFDDSTARRI